MKKIQCLILMFAGISAWANGYDPNEYYTLKSEYSEIKTALSVDEGESPLRPDEIARAAVRAREYRFDQICPDRHTFEIYPESHLGWRKQYLEWNNAKESEWAAFYMELNETIKKTRR